MPLGAFLDAAPALVAEVLDAEVASLYLLEADGETIVLRGNHGFGESALGRVRMRVGQGLTGLAIADRRPLRVAHGPSHDLFLGFPELREERYPVFAVAPVMGPEGPTGGLVVQRARRPFSEAEVELLMALGAAIFAALRSAEVFDLLRGGKAPRQSRAPGLRRALLSGRPVTPGRALGTLAATRRPGGSSQGASGQAGVSALGAAIAAARRRLEAVAREAAEGHADAEAAWEAPLQVLADGRFLGRALSLVEAGAPVGEALGQVAREAARAAVRVSRDPFSAARAREIEALCEALTVIAAGRGAARLPSRPVVMARDLTVFDLLVTARHKPAAFVLAEEADDRTRALAQLLGVPVLAGLAGLFGWATEGDLALVDSDHGYLHVNPGRLDVAEVKAAR